MPHITEQLEPLDNTRIHIHESQLRPGVPHVFEAGDVTAVGYESDRGSIGCPSRLEVGELVIGELYDCAGFEIQPIDVTDSTHEAGEGDVLTVRGPRWAGDGPNIIQINVPLDLAVVDVDDGEFIVALGEHCEDELLPVGGPVSGRVDEA